MGKSQGSDLKYRKGIPGMLESLEPLLEYNAILSLGYNEQKPQEQRSSRKKDANDKGLANELYAILLEDARWKRKSRETFSSL